MNLFYPSIFFLQVPKNIIQNGKPTFSVIIQTDIILLLYDCGCENMCVEWVREDDHHRVPEVCDDGGPAARLLQGRQLRPRPQDGQGDHRQRCVLFSVGFSWIPMLYLP